MKLVTIIEAKYHNTRDKVAIHEIIGGRGGDIDHFKSVVQLDKLIKYIEAAAAGDDDVLESEEMEDIPYSVSAVMYNYKPHEIFNAMKAKKGWSGYHEEGVIGMSTRGPAHAKLLAASAWADDEDEDEEEDWY